MEAARPQTSRALIAAAAAGLAALALLGPSRFGSGITAPEARWIHDAPGFAARAADVWAALVPSDLVFRLPVIALVGLVAAGIVLRLAGASRLSAGTALAAALALGAQIALAAGGPAVGSIAPAAALTTALLVAVFVRMPAGSAAVLGGIALVMGLLEPGLAAFPAGAAAISLVPGSRRPGRSWIGVMLALAAAVLALRLLFVRAEGLVWLQGSGHTAGTIQKAVLVLGVGSLVFAATGPRRTDPDSRRALSFVPVALGGVLASLAWLSAAPLRALSTSPLVVLLMVMAPLGALAIAARAFAVSAESAAPAGALPRPEGSSGTRAHPPVSRAATVLAAILAVLSLGAFAKRHDRPLDVLPIGEALGRVRAAAPGLREVLAGPGLTRGVLAHTARRAGFTVVEQARDERVAMLAVGSQLPAIAERDALVPRLGDRVLERYGLAGAGTPLRWTTYRPLSLKIDPAGDRPNIAIVSVDTLRADHLGFHGYPRATSPLLDRWAGGALVYERAMSAAPATAPSFSSLMTGRLPIAHGVRKNYEFLDPGHWTLARILERAGYDTAGFVSSFVLTRENSGLDLGIGRYDQAFSGREQNREDRPLRLAPELSASVGAWIEGRRGSDKPWFLWVHAIDPHGPYTPLPEFRGAFEGGATKKVPRALIPPYQWLGTEDFATYVNAYDDEVLQTDRSLGPLIAAIEALPSPRGTIVVFTADHGEAFGEHGHWFEHGQSLHTEEIHVPLVVKDTGRPRAGRVTSPVSLLDLAPTLLARLSIEADLPFDGVRLDAREGDGAPVLLANWRPGDVMACRAPWKFVIHGGRRGKRGDGEHDAPPGAHEAPQEAAAVRLLYDIDLDPGEGRPVTGRPEAASALQAAALALLERDPLDAASGRALERRQWESLSPEAKEKLRSLGYAGP